LGELGPQWLRQVGHGGKVSDAFGPDPLKNLRAVEPASAQIHNRSLDFGAIEFGQIKIRRLDIVHGGGKDAPIMLSFGTWRLLLNPSK
jgi:hypothetical protein